MGTSSWCSPKLSLLGVLLNMRVPFTSSILPRVLEETSLILAYCGFAKASWDHRKLYSTWYFNVFFWSVFGSSILGAFEGSAIANPYSSVHCRRSGWKKKSEQWITNGLSKFIMMIHFPVFQLPFRRTPHWCPTWPRTFQYRRPEGRRHVIQRLRLQFIRFLYVPFVFPPDASVHVHWFKRTSR